MWNLLVFGLIGSFAQESLVGSALEAGADRGLMRPLHAKEVASLLVQTRSGNQPGSGEQMEDLG